MRWAVLLVLVVLLAGSVSGLVKTAPEAPVLVKQPVILPVPIVVNETPEEEAPSLKVEAYDKDLVFDDRLGEVATSDSGFYDVEEVPDKTYDAMKPMESSTDERERYMRAIRVKQQMVNLTPGGSGKFKKAEVNITAVSDVDTGDKKPELKGTLSGGDDEHKPDPTGVAKLPTDNIDEDVSPTSGVSPDDKKEGAGGKPTLWSRFVGLFRGGGDVAEAPDKCETPSGECNPIDRPDIVNDTKLDKEEGAVTFWARVTSWMGSFGRGMHELPEMDDEDDISPGAVKSGADDFLDAMNSTDVVMYGGQGRYGTGPDLNESDKEKMGDLSKKDMLAMESAQQKADRVMGTLSNVQKDIHDTQQGIIRNMDGGDPDTGMEKLEVDVPSDLSGMSTEDLLALFLKLQAQDPEPDDPEFAPVRAELVLRGMVNETGQKAKDAD